MSDLPRLPDLIRSIRTSLRSDGDPACQATLDRALRLAEAMCETAQGAVLAEQRMISSLLHEVVASAPSVAGEPVELGEAERRFARDIREGRADTLSGGRLRAYFLASLERRLQTFEPRGAAMQELQP